MRQGLSYEMETGGHCEHIAPYRILKIEVKTLVMDSMEVTVLTCKCTEIDRADFPAWQDIKHAVNITRLESGGILSVISELQHESGINGIQRTADTVDTVDTEDGGDTGYTHVARSTA